jgi:hypothetical protein
MLIVPVRRMEDADGGLTCLLGSEPRADAPRHFLPSECVVNRAAAEGCDLGVLTLDESKLPDGIRKALGIR